MEVGAVRAGQREVVDDDVGRVGLAQHVIARQHAQQLVGVRPARAAPRGRPGSAQRAQQHARAAPVAMRAPSRTSAARSSGSFTSAARLSSCCHRLRGSGLGSGGGGGCAATRPGPGGCRRSGDGRNRRSPARRSGRRDAGSRAPTAPATLSRSSLPARPARARPAAARRAASGARARRRRSRSTRRAGARSTPRPLPRLCGARPDVSRCARPPMARKPFSRMDPFKRRSLC